MRSARIASIEGMSPNRCRLRTAGFGLGAMPHFAGQVLPNKISGGDTDYTKVSNWLQNHRDVFIFNCPE
jgi:hypothetical protein